MIVQTLWIGPRLSLVEQLSIQSFLDHGHQVHLYVYEEVAGVPAGTTILDAAQIAPYEPEKFRQRNPADGSVRPEASFSDVFRFTLLARKGGIWVDVDVVCLQPFEIADDIVMPRTSGWLTLGRDPGLSVDSWFLKVPPASEMMRFCQDEAQARAGMASQWGDFGPVLVERAVRRFGLEACARTDLFFPLGWSRCHLLLERSRRAELWWSAFSRRRIALHLFRSTWDEQHVATLNDLGPETVFGRLRQRHPIRV